MLVLRNRPTKMCSAFLHPTPAAVIWLALSCQPNGKCWGTISTQNTKLSKIRTHIHCLSEGHITPHNGISFLQICTQNYYQQGHVHNEFPPSCYWIQQTKEQQVPDNCQEVLKETERVKVKRLFLQLKHKTQIIISLHTSNNHHRAVSETKLHPTVTWA